MYEIEQYIAFYRDSLNDDKTPLALSDTRGIHF